MYLFVYHSEFSDLVPIPGCEKSLTKPIHVHVLQAKNQMSLCIHIVISVSLLGG